MSALIESAQTQVLTLPGRLQTATGTREFERWRARVRQQMRDAAIAPIAPPRALELELHVYYALEPPAQPTDDLAALGIPRITVAAEALLIALAGHLYERRNQINTLIIHRRVLPADELVQMLGHEWRHGGAMVRWQEAEC